MSDRIAVMSQGHVEQIGTPQDIYRSPASLFVAGFIGSANLLPGTVQSHDGADAVIALKAGSTIRVAGQATAHAIGAHVSVMLRPERLRPTVQPESDGQSLQGTLTDLVFQGATARMIVRLADGTELTCLADSSARMPQTTVGSTMNVSWDADGGYILAGWPDKAGSTSTDVDHIESTL
jgi:spermidine/putrescine transport system ATP-binding protein